MAEDAAWMLEGLLLGRNDTSSTLCTVRAFARDRKPYIAIDSTTIKLHEQHFYATKHSDA